MAKSKQCANITDLVHLLHRASQSAEELYVRRAADLDPKFRNLTPRQIIVLNTVALEGGLSQTVIGLATGVDRSTLADIVRRLVSRGLLARRRTKSDARRYAVRLTDEGRRALELCLPVWREADKLIQETLTASQQQDFCSALQRVVNLTALEPEKPNRGIAA
jgi:DNA-binding MarR family transcriptional regulator